MQNNKETFHNQDNKLTTGNIIKVTFLRLIHLKRLWMLLLFPISLLLVQLAKVNMTFAESVYADGFYKIYSQIFSSVTGLVPFSVAEAGILSGFIVIPAALIIWVIRIMKARGERSFYVFRGIINLLCLGSLIYFMLMLGCGINYYREPFSYFADLTIQDSSVDELYGLCSELASRASEARAQLTSFDDEGVYQLPMSQNELEELCLKAYKTAGEEYPVFTGIYPASKAVHFSTFMSRTELTGIFVPFTMEANVNTEASDYSIASTICHEQAHLRGFIREDEANYISYLVCTASDSYDLQYSGLMEALILAGNKLYAGSTELYYEARALYSDGVINDLRANSAYWSQFRDTKISNTTDKLNDSYLKANNQSDGVQSYGRMVDLLLAEYRQKHQVR